MAGSDRNVWPGMPFGSNPGWERSLPAHCMARATNNIFRFIGHADNGPTASKKWNCLSSPATCSAASIWAAR